MTMRRYDVTTNPAGQVATHRMSADQLVAYRRGEDVFPGLFEVLHVEPVPVSDDESLPDGSDQVS